MIKKISVGIIFPLLVLLNGCGRIKVASVVGEEVGYAKGILVSQGLQVKAIKKEIDGVPEGQVLTQDPPPEASIKKGELVTLTVVKSPLKVASVTGEELGYAKGILVGQGLRVKTVEEEIADVPEGQVLAQDPPSETSVKKGDLVTLTIAKSPFYEIDGNITLIDSDLGGYGENCYGTGGYSDISAGMSITVRDDNGTIVATGQTDSGNHPQNDSYSSVICVFKFNVTQIPKRNFYTIELGRRGKLSYSFAELEETNWELSLSLG